MSVSSAPHVTRSTAKYPCSFCRLEDYDGGIHGSGHYFDKWEHHLCQFHVIRGTRARPRAEMQIWWSCSECHWKYFDLVRRWGYPHIRMFADLRRSIRAMPSREICTFDIIMGGGLGPCILGKCRNRFGARPGSRLRMLSADLMGIILPMIGNSVQVRWLPPKGCYPANPKCLCDFCYQIVIVGQMDL